MPEDDPGDPDGAPLSEIADSEQEFDQELGKAMGEAAKKLRTGEMTEAEFYEQFHDQVVEEFGFDDRPVEPDED
ncbi:4Fe-4S ferredoxin N-terminal domain-containing protein [Halodesulfurarchaeum sp. HSR-GB]|uniref:4Fe-4S ferredoxin N-terminal domain-containing protein n=1 Tax=Halodesulfurarchaeum sp. HSR-GB TaxID=3074077 RepID=UPI002864B19F|nr:4Fe-4S ferredoxin N-terminal domain-containing protein [Halodesulfurarchaeum sp. HSR-GB]MDR5656535.1 4Fe-4S ferredoxin N-terminal domain-containing protein [Halodesulfurarchaeum sp. HSR-GB]